jgi:IclR family mhp operon transcriptional activator
VRGLSILEIINLHRNIELKELVRESSLPRATVIRLLDTLIEAGFVLENRQLATFEPAPRVMNLANGYHFENWLETTSSPILLALLEQIGWPSDIMFLYGDRMRACASNRAFCAMQVNRSYVGVGGPLCYSAAGRAYLAWCEESELERLLHQSARVQEHKKIRLELEQTKLRGYSIRDPSIEPKIGAIGVPVMYKGTVACTLTCIYICESMSINTVVAKSVGPMRAAADQLEAAYLSSFETVKTQSFR